MAIEVFNRCEKKYLITERQYEIIQQKIQERMELDAYNREHEYYSICNLYYDTADHSLIRSSIEKPAYKEKLRMRSYGIPSMQDKVYVEIKKKYKGVVNKRRTGMILSDAYDYLNYGIYPDFEQEVNQSMINRQVFTEIDYFKNYYQIEPKVYISYLRKAYFDREDSDFRVTFDKDITTRRNYLELESGCFGEPLLAKGTYLMEIKINRSVPMWFTKILSELCVYPTTFSKYGMEYKKYISSKNRKEEKGEQLCSNQYLQVQQRRMPLASARLC